MDPTKVIQNLQIGLSLAQSLSQLHLRGFGDLSNKNQHQLGSYLEIQPTFADWSGLGNPIWDLTSNQQQTRDF